MTNNSNNIHPDILDELHTVPAPEEEDKDLAHFLTDVDWKGESIEDEIFDPTLPDLPVNYTLEWNGTMFAPLGGIAGMNGRPGNGKTMSFSMMIAAILRGEYMGLRCLLKDEPTVLYIDTEMEMVNTQRAIRRIYEMTGWEQMTKQPRLNTICLREVNDAVSRWRKILKAIWQFKPTVVFLDGLIDVVADFNDNKECQERIYQCMSVATHYNISMWCLLHLNPGSDKAVGHLGSFLERKATDIWLTAQDKETQGITISHEKHRMKKAANICYSIKDDEKHYGIPQIDFAIPTIEKEEFVKDYNDEEIEALLLKHIAQGDNLSFTTLRERIRIDQSIGATKSRDIINRGVILGIIKCENSRYYRADLQRILPDPADSSLHDDNGPQF